MTMSGGPCRSGLAVHETAVHPDRAAPMAEFDTENHPTLLVVENTDQKCVAGCRVFDAEQTGQIRERAELAVRQFSEGQRAVLHRIRIAVEFPWPVFFRGSS